MSTRVRTQDRPVLLVAIMCLGMAETAVAKDHLSLDEHELFFELNDTDGDLGIHASIDGGPPPWRVGR